MQNYELNAQKRMEALRQSGHATLLAIETSCDETAAAVVRDGREVLSNAVYTQIPLHQRFGGVVPEVASRNHVEQITTVVNQALEQANTSLDGIDGIAVTCGPGLVGALLVGVSYAKGLALSRDLPLFGVNHIAGHIAANYISHPELTPPFVCLIASGGHSHIVLVEDYAKFRLIGRTRDDAAGEAFDKVARVLGLPYPGGPNLEKLAATSTPEGLEFPRALSGQATFDFSFSGVKTAVINYLHTAEQKGQDVDKAKVAAAFQHNVISTLSDKAVSAAVHAGVSRLALAGGVSANRALCAMMESQADKAGLTFYCPAFSYCTDNAAMIGCAGYYMLLQGERASLSLNANPRLSLAFVE